MTLGQQIKLKDFSVSRALMTIAHYQYIIIAIATRSSKSLSEKMIKPSIYVHKREVHII